VSTLVTSIKSLAEQAATGTMTADNRQEIATQVRQYFEQLISLANTTYSGQSLFSGQKTDTEAYAETLWMTSNDDAFDRSWLPTAASPSPATPTTPCSCSFRLQRRHPPAVLPLLPGRRRHLGQQRHLRHLGLGRHPDPEPRQA